MLKKGNPIGQRTSVNTLISRLVEENKDVLRAKFGSGVTTIRKTKAWQKISFSISSTSYTNGSVEWVKEKWHYIQMQGKADLSDARRSMKMTGTGIFFS